MFGSASSREGLEKLQAGVDELLAGQKVTNELLKQSIAISREILDVLKSNKAEHGRRDVAGN